MSNILKFRGQTIDNGTGRESANAFHHRKALEGHTTAPQGRALRKLLEGWAEYATVTQREYSEPGEPPYTLSQDGVLGPYWAELGLAIHRLLDGETGGWDCGSLSGNILETLEEQGFHSPDAHTVEVKQ